MTQTIHLKVHEASNNVGLSVGDGPTSLRLTGEEARVIQAVSPTAEVERVDNGVLVRMHDLNGETEATVFDGEKGDTGDPGQNGVSPTVQTADIAGGHRVTITDAEGSHEFDVMNGAKGDPGEKGDQGDQGEKGAKGDPGNPGYTPVRGTDYWTQADQSTVIAAAVEAVLDAYPAAEEVEF